MKTNKILLMLLFSVFFTLNGAAQTEYSTTRTIQGDGYSYQCDNEGGSIMLYNSNDQFTYAIWERRDGLPVDVGYFDGTIPTIINTIARHRQAQSIAVQIFTREELISVMELGPTLMIRMIIDPLTGNVAEVNFQFPETTGYAQFPLERYRQIELAIKENITFEITEAGKKLNYCITGFFFAPLFFFPVG